MKYIFGPVPSRRLGLSVGIDMVPFKTCSLNCIYCECGSTTNLTATRAEYVPTSDLIAELDTFLSSPPPFDVITFAGSGEPTLSTNLGTIITYVKKRYPSYKTAILTNSTLLHLKEVRESIVQLDYVLPSLDAVTQEVFEKINRSAAAIQCDTIINGLRTFSKEYAGHLWLEIFIVPGINDTESELGHFKKILHEIKPTRIQLNTLDRPGAVSDVQPASRQRLYEIADYFQPLAVEIIARSGYTFQNSSNDSKTFDMIHKAIQRRPMTIEDLARCCNKSINEIKSFCDDLLKDKYIKVQNVAHNTFYVYQRDFDTDSKKTQ